MNVDDLKKVAVIGAGAMGQQIALHTALHGYRAACYDSIPAQVEKAAAWCGEYLAGRVAKGRLTREQADAAAALVAWTGDLAAAVADADLVIEAVVEKLEVKRQVFAELDRLAPARAILATNSSTIVSSRVADATGRPDRVANLHYFNPALVMPVVEVVQGPHTSQETAACLVEFCRRTGKQPIWMKKEIPGFVANRLLHALAREALFLLENGYATHEEIDLAAEKALGHPMGPFRLMDLTGIDVAYLARLAKYQESGDPQDLPPRAIQEKYERGEFGRKAGRGWYTYSGEV